MVNTHVLIAYSNNGFFFQNTKQGFNMASGMHLPVILKLESEYTILGVQEFLAYSYTSYVFVL